MKKILFIVAIILAGQMAFSQNSLKKRVYAYQKSDSLFLRVNGDSIYLGKTDYNFFAPAYFPTVDSLRNFISRYVRGSAIEAFTNLRLQTALMGIAQFLDSARLVWSGGGGGGGDNNFPSSLSFSLGTLTLGRTGLSNLTTSITTSNIPEAGGILFFTTARARQSIVNGYGWNYNNTTGVGTLDTSVLGSISVIKRTGFDTAARIVGNNVFLKAWNFTIGNGNGSITKFITDTSIHIEINPTGSGGGGSLDGTLATGNITTRSIIQQSLTDPESYDYWEGRPSNYLTTYSGFGKQMGMSTSWVRVNGVNSSGRPNVVWNIAGYNTNPGGGRIDAAEAAFRYALELHYETIGKQLFEWHMPEFTDSAGGIHRLMSWYVDKSGIQRATPTLNGGGMGFTTWNDPNTIWGAFSDGGQIYNVQQFDANVHPKLTLGSVVKWTNQKWNFELQFIDSGRVQLGRPSADLADNAIIQSNDNFYVGSAGAALQRALVVNGNVVFTSELNSNPPFYFNATHAGVSDIFRVDYQSGRRFIVGKDVMEIYTPVIFANTTGVNTWVWMPRGTTAERNGTPSSAYFRYNTDSARFEGHNGTNWKGIAWTWDGGGGGGLSDGDKGDITVTSSGAVWSIDGDIVTFPKMQNIATNKLLGRSTAGTGDIEEISIGSGLSLSGGTLTATGGAGGAFINNGNAFGGPATIGTTDANDLIFFVGGTEAGRFVDAGNVLKVGTGIQVNSPTWGVAAVEFNGDLAILNNLKMFNGSNVLTATSGTEIKINAAGFGRVVVGGGTVGFDASTYLNWATTYGSGGYGFRDNAGAMEFKNSGGSWAAFGAGFTEGSYTPTLTNVSNVAASTAFTCYWYRIGNKVTVFGKVSVDPTSASTQVQLGISLPVASGFGTDGDLAGTATVSEIQGLAARILADATNSRAEFQVMHTDVGNRTYSFQFSYHVTPP